MGQGTGAGPSTAQPPDVWLDADGLRFGERLTVRLVRTLRVPDEAEGGALPVPPGIGMFPARPVDRVDADATMRQRGGIVVPMRQREALRLTFEAVEPIAVQVSAGLICAVSGRDLVPGLAPRPQNYLVAPDQPWIDGFKVAEGIVRQFVAALLGLGATVEEQLVTQAAVGGVQLRAFRLGEDARRLLAEERRKWQSRPGSANGPSGAPEVRLWWWEEHLWDAIESRARGPEARARDREMRRRERDARRRDREAFRREQERRQRDGEGDVRGAPSPSVPPAAPSGPVPRDRRRRSAGPLPSQWDPELVPTLAAPPAEDRLASVIGLGMGGAIRQVIARDAFGVDAWEPEPFGSAWIHLADARGWAGLTGEAVPRTPVDASTYERARLPWLELYDADREDVEASARLARARTVTDVLGLPRRRGSQPGSVVRFRRGDDWRGEDRVVVPPGHWSEWTDAPMPIERDVVDDAGDAPE